MFFAQVSNAGMAKSSKKADLTALIEQGAQASVESAKEVRATVSRTPASHGEPTVTLKKAKFEDLVPTMEQFNLMQEQNENSDGLAAQ